MEENFFSLNLMGETKETMETLSRVNEDTIESTQVVFQLKTGETITLHPDEITLHYEIKSDF